MKLPALRNVDAVPVQQDGEQLICLYDPSGIVEHQLLLSPTAFFVAANLDGETTLTDIQHAFARDAGGILLPTDDMRSVVNYLDDHGFLLTEKFFEIQDKLLEEFRNSPARPAHLAGKSYPADPEELKAFLNGLFAHEKGPGPLTARAPQNGATMPCLVVPHIDYHRGGHTYAHGYAALYAAGAPDVAFIFGVAHAAQPVPFILTRKDFDTPLGVMQTDQDIVSRLEAACDWDPFEHELVHKSEHSVEFQAVMLAHVFGTSVKIVPILCSMLSEDHTNGDPREFASANAMIAECRRIAEERPGKVLAIASADLAHVGRRFGDDFDIDDGVVHAVRSRDDEDLAFVRQGDGAGFYTSVMKDRNARKVCGVNCIYAALKTMEEFAGDGVVTHYDYAPDPAGGIVSFASVHFDGAGARKGRTPGPFGNI